MGYPNGQIPAHALRKTVIRGSLREDASKSVDRMALQYATDTGTSLFATDTYRPLADQWALWNSPKRHLAAYPGTSNHGWGLAVDFSSGMNQWGSPAQKWFAENGRHYGWLTPGWANPNSPSFQKNEPWHKEFNPDLDRSNKRFTLNYPGKGELGLGSSGPEVKRLQEFLNAIYRGKAPRIAPDGEYGMATYALVRRFQRARGWNVRTGTVGKWTRILLRRRGFKG